MTPLVLAVIVAYLLGSVLGSLVAGRFRGVDIRTQGSGNPGGTNALRTQGKGFAALVMAIDVGKGALAAGPVAWTAATMSSAVSTPTLQALCGAAAVIGHVWPVFFGFRGGKGAATLVGVLAVIAPLALLVVLVVFGLVLTTTGFVGLSTIVATAAVAVWAVIVAGAASPLALFALAMTGFIVYTHRSNIARLRAGTEHRFERVMWRRPNN